MKRDESYFLSDDIDILLDRLILDVFQNSNFFSKRIIFFNDQNYKRYFFKSIVEKKKIAMGFEVLSNFSHLFSIILNFFETDKKYPKLFDVNLAIFSKIYSEILKKKSSKYLEISKFFENLESLEKRQKLLASEIFKYFQKYNFYETSEESWVNEFLEELFLEKNWIFAKNLNNLELKKKIEENISLYFCNISHFPEIFYRILKKIFKKIDCKLYMFSPCQFYWEDIFSDYDRERLLSYYEKKKEKLLKIKNLENLLTDVNPFLANYGKIARKNFGFIDENFEEKYSCDFLDKKDCDEQNFLNTLRNDILLFSSIDEKKKKNVDDSFQIHKTSSRLREVEVLFENIAKLLDEKKGLKLSEINVYAKNIQSYLPYVELVFDGKIPFRVNDISIISKSSFASIFIELLSLVDSKWEFSKIFKIFKNKILYKKIALKKEEILAIESIFKHFNVLWGRDLFHREKFVKTKKNLSLNSFEKGFEQVFEALFTNESDISLSTSDISYIEKFIKCFFDLSADIEYLEKNDFFTASKWEQILKTFYQNYFEIDKQDNFDKICENKFLNFLEKLKSYGLNSDEKFSKFFIFEKITSLFNEKTFSINSYIDNAVSFSEIKKDNILPSKAIFLLGIDENFPRKESFAFDMKFSTFIPKKIEEDKFSFLQAIFHAKDQLTLSYSSIDDLENTLFIKEILSYLKKMYNFETEIDKNHIPTSFLDQKNTFCKKTYDYFSAFSKTDEKIINVTLKESENKKDENCENILNIRDLTHFSKNSIKYYFNKILNIYLDETFIGQDVLKISEKYLLTHLEKYLIRNQIFSKKPIEETIESLDKKGFFPPGIFREIEKKKLFKEILFYKKSLEKLNIKQEDIFNTSLCLDKNVEDQFFEIDFDGKKIKVVGDIENISKHGMLDFSNKSTLKLLNIWPKFLIFSKIYKNYDKNIFFLKDRKVLNVKDLADFSAFLKFFNLAKVKRPLFAPEWIRPIALKDKKKLDIEILKFSKDGQMLENVYLKRAYLGQKGPNADQLIDEWSEILNEVYKPILDI